MTVLDLALKTFERVVPFYLYLVPGLRFDRERLEFCEQRFGVKVMQFPHPTGIDAFKSETYVDPWPEFDALPDLDLVTADRWVMGETKTSLVLTGEKKADGLWRRRTIAKTKTSRPWRIRPIKDWLRWEVLSYLKGRQLPIPHQAGDSSGISLGVREILWLHDHQRDDYEIIRSYFPYVETIVLKREWFGVTDG